LLTPGQKIFEYEVIRQLGEGGFAAVFEAVDKLLNRQVAIKQLLPGKVGERVLKRFIQEARVAAALEHPNVITIYGLRIADQRIYIILEYLPGGSLQELLLTRGKLPVEQALRLAIGICEGLAKLHVKGIIHRDIKAENILLTADGRPKVTDFGIAHMPEAVGGMGLTLVGVQPSTLLFSSPEQLRGEELDARSDVYQVGELLYYMLTGEHYINLRALEARAQLEAEPHVNPQLKLFELLEQAVCEEMPEGLQNLWREVGTLASLVERALAKDKEQRFNDALEFAAALQAVNINTAPPVVQEEKLKLLDSRTYNRRGLAHASMRNYEQAIYDYTKAIQLDRHFAEAYNNRSAAHLLMENYAQAVLDCNWAIELAPHFIAAYVNRGIANTGLRQYEEALLDYNKVIELNDQSVYAYYNRGNTYMWMGEHQKALADYSRVIKLNPEFLAAYVNRGVVYDQLGEWAKALEDYNRAILLNAGYVYAYYNRANAYQALGRYEQAITDYNKVIELNPEHLYAYENRGRAFLRVGNTERASRDQARVMIQIPTINPKQVSVARSMLMPATPLDFLTRREGDVA
jgi:serine/threonine protein kinase/regulator of sirC expression with transglutaminase-like and TPR domain